MYNKNCGKKMFGKKMYFAPGGNLMNQVVFKNMGRKMRKFMLKWVPTPNNLEDKEDAHAKTNSKTPQHR